MAMVTLRASGRDVPGYTRRRPPGWSASRYAARRAVDAAQARRAWMGRGCVARTRGARAAQRSGRSSAATRSSSSMRVSFTRGRPAGSPRERSWRSISDQPA